MSEYNVTTTSMMGQEMPFLPAAPPTWYANKVLERFSHADVMRFGPAPTDLFASLSKELPSLAKVLHISEVPFFAHEELAPGVSIAFITLAPNTPRAQHRDIMSRMASALNVWYNEFPDEEALVTDWIRSQRAKWQAEHKGIPCKTRKRF